MVWNYQNADYSFKKLIHCVIYYNFPHTFIRYKTHLNTQVYTFQF